MRLADKLSLLASTAALLGASPLIAQDADVSNSGGDIVTIDDQNPTAEALSVKDGLILSVGDLAGIEAAHLGAATRLVDLGGRTLISGFIDQILISPS